MEKIALLILTLAANGDPRVSLSETDGMEDCEGTREVVTQILTDIGRTPVHAICGPTDVRLTPYVHGTAPEDEIYRYRVTIAGDSYAMEPLGEGANCASSPEAEPMVYCARSSQKVIAEES